MGQAIYKAVNAEFKLSAGAAGAECRYE